MAIPLKGRRATPVARDPLQGIVPKVETAQLPRHSEPWTKLIPSISFSMAVHAILLLVLSWIYFDLPNNRVLESILSLVIADTAPLGEVVEFPAEPLTHPGMELGEVALEPIEDSIVEPQDFDPPEPVSLRSEVILGMDQIRGIKPELKVPSKATAVKTTKQNNGPTKKGIVTEDEAQNTDHFVGRSPKVKAALLKRMGGTDASEAAVARGLVWLKNHQFPDGSWNFDHQGPRCDCTMPGNLVYNPNAATAMALMAFLGAGQTHESGDYQPEVREGLDFLLANGVRVEKGICFYGQLSGSQTFYTHGLVTIALGEALAMTGDARLRPAVTGAVEFLAATQATGGGWRYFPGQPGDTSVVAWELMALKSAQFSRIPVPQKVFRGVDQFMGSVASHRGTQYAYTADRRDSPTLSMTAAGLLCRMYLDWDENQGKLLGGIRILDQNGPDPNNMYYNYYATQVMHHWGGPEWDRWNKLMREYLIHTQILDGHASGSWDVADRHGYAGGRLYMTSLALLTLEVYYRHLPLYQKDRIEVPLIHEAVETKKP